MALLKVKSTKSLSNKFFVRQVFVVFVFLGGGGVFFEYFGEFSGCKFC